jgi:alpha-L-fucosidase
VIKAGNFNEDKIKYSDQDIRFTTKGNSLFVFFMNTPTGDLQIKSLGRHSTLNTKKIISVHMLGSSERIRYQQNNDGLAIRRPDHLPDWKVLGFEIELQ